MDTISVYVTGNENVEQLVSRNWESIGSDVMATALTAGSTAGYVKEWNINGETVTLAVEKNAN